MRNVEPRRPDGERRPRHAGVERIAVGLLLGLAVGLAIPTVLAEPGDLISISINALYGVVGAFLALRRPANPIGWMFLGILLVFVASSAGESLGGTVVLSGGPLPAGAPLALIWIETWAFQALFGLYYGLTLVFPSGHLPGGRIGRVARISLLVPIAGVVVSAFGPHLAGVYSPDTLGRALPNPAALLPLEDGLDHLLEIATIGLLLSGVIAMIVRLRRARGIEREQLKWLVASLSLTGVLVAIVLTILILDLGSGPATWTLALLGYATIPPAVGIAVLRYRLYEIDRIVSRTIGWAVVSAVLVVVFAVVVVGVQAVLAPVTASNTLAVAASTLVVATLFQPLRSRIQARVDRRFNRSRHDAQQTMGAFADRLRAEVDLAQLVPEITTVVGRTVEPASVSLWIRRSAVDI